MIIRFTHFAAAMLAMSTAAVRIGGNGIGSPPVRALEFSGKDRLDTLEFLVASIAEAVPGLSLELEKRTKEEQEKLI